MPSKWRKPESLKRKPGLRERQRRLGFVQSRKDWRKSLKNRDWLSLQGLKPLEFRMLKSQLIKRGLELRLKLEKLNKCVSKLRLRLAMRKKKQKLPSELVLKPLLNRKLVRERRPE